MNYITDVTSSGLDKPLMVYGNLSVGVLVKWDKQSPIETR